MVLCHFILKEQLTNQDYYMSIHNMAITEAILKAALLTPVIALSLHRSCWQQKNSKLSNRKESAISFVLHWDFFQQEKVLNLPVEPKKLNRLREYLTVTLFLVQTEAVLWLPLLENRTLRRRQSSICDRAHGANTDIVWKPCGLCCHGIDRKWGTAHWAWPLTFSRRATFGKVLCPVVHLLSVPQDQP